MEKEQFDAIKKDMDTLKKLLALGLQQQGVSVEAIGKAMSISKGRVSQLIAQKKYKKRVKKTA